MRNLVLQVQVTEDRHVRKGKQYEYIEELYAASKEAAKGYASRTGSEYRCLTSLMWVTGESATFQKLALLGMDEYDYILYVDSDAIVQPDCPDIFSLGLSGLAAVPDFDPVLHRHAEDRKIHALGLLNRPFCAGVLFADRGWRQAVRWRVKRLMDDNKSMIEQDILNKAHDDVFEEYHQLSPDWGAWYCTGKYIDHFGGTRRKNEWKISGNR